MPGCPGSSSSSVTSGGAIIAFGSIGAPYSIRLAFSIGTRLSPPNGSEMCLHHHFSPPWSESKSGPKDDGPPGPKNGSGGPYGGSKTSPELRRLLDRVRIAGRDGRLLLLIEFDLGRHAA